MPKWTLPAGSIKPLVVFHGTDDTALGATGVPPGSQLSGFRINLARCRPNTDFGQGFYATTSEHQARQWANSRWVRSPASGTNAVVLRFALDRDWLASLDALAFARPIPDFWDLVADCRNGFRPHQRLPPHNPPFDIVYGPVTIWPQLLVIQDCDQISFHTSRAAQGIGLRDPWIHAVGSPTF
ncbi:MAG TPA: DUF3990 domain-containing protein [Acetobacteraceae bacterium]|nr:DUF3990 domain-containing protein [Acetobacteraceae bacterium]